MDLTPPGIERRAKRAFETESDGGRGGTAWADLPEWTRDAWRREVIELDDIDAAQSERRGLQHLAEGGMCVHSKYYENCAGCIIRELSRALGMLIDMHDGKFKGKPFHGLVTETEEGVWDAARERLRAVERSPYDDDLGMTTAQREAAADE